MQQRYDPGIPAELTFVNDMGRLFYNVPIDGCGDLTLVPMNTVVHVHVIWRHDAYTWLAKVSVPSPTYSNIPGCRCHFTVNLAGISIEV